MNIFSELFGIFRQRGLVATYKEGGRLTGFAVSALLLVILGGALYGFSMGIGLGIETGLKDAMKVALIAVLALLLSIPIFWVAYRLLGHQQSSSQVAGVPITLVAAVALVLVVTAPIVFMLSILAGYSPYAVYIHVVILNLALLVGLYLAGTLIYHGFPERTGLIVPNVISFLLMGVILVVLMSFLGPYLAPSRTFSVGTDRLLAGLGIGVEETVGQALVAAQAADRVSYTYQNTNENGDLVRDYTVTRVGDDTLLELHTHAISGEQFLSDVRVWELDGLCFTDFAGGRVSRVPREELLSILEPALAPKAFSLPGDFEQASWRAYEGGGRYTATATYVDQRQARLVLDADSGRLKEMVLGSATKGVHAESRVKEIATAELDRAGLVASLNQATVLGAVDHSDASMQDYVQEDTLFVVRYPRTWRAQSWNATGRQMEFTSISGYAEGNPRLTVNVYDLSEGKGPRQYAEDLAHSLSLLAEYRNISTDLITIDGKSVGVVEYLHDRTVKGEIETTRLIEYIYEGQLSRYHLKFAAPEGRFELHQTLFAEMAGQFTYLRAALWDSALGDD